MKKVWLVGIMTVFALVSAKQAALAYRILPPPVPMAAYPAPQDTPRMAVKSTFQLMQHRMESRMSLENKNRPSPLRAPRLVPRVPVTRASALRTLP